MHGLADIQRAGKFNDPAVKFEVATEVSVMRLEFVSLRDSNLHGIVLPSEKFCSQCQLDMARMDPLLGAVISKISENITLDDLTADFIHRRCN